MYLLNGTPLNDLVIQALCTSSYALESEDSNFLDQKKIQLIFDKNALIEAVKDITPEDTAPVDFAKQLLSLHFAEYEENTFHVWSQGDIRDPFYTNPSVSNELSTIFPDAVNNKTFFKMSFTDHPATDILSELGISKDKVLFFESVFKARGYRNLHDLIEEDSGRKDIPDYQVSEEKDVETYHKEALRFKNGYALDYCIGRGHPKFDIEHKEMSFAFNGEDFFQDVMRALFDKTHGSSPENIIGDNRNSHGCKITTQQTKEYGQHAISAKIEFSDDKTMETIVKAFSMDLPYQKALEEQTQKASLDHDPGTHYEL